MAAWWLPSVSSLVLTKVWWSLFWHSTVYANVSFVNSRSTICIFFWNFNYWAASAFSFTPIFLANKWLYFLIVYYFILAFNFLKFEYFMFTFNHWDIDFRLFWIWTILLDLWVYFRFWSFLVHIFLLILNLLHVFDCFLSLK